MTDIMSRQLSGDSLQAPSHSRTPSGSMSGAREDGAASASAGSPPAASSAETKVRKEERFSFVFNFHVKGFCNPFHPPLACREEEVSKFTQSVRL